MAFRIETTGDYAFQVVDTASPTPPTIQNTVLVESLSDFPTPVAGEILLANDTKYAVSGTVTIDERSVLIVRTSSGAS